MVSSRTILKNLRNIDQYLKQFPQQPKSVYFEKLIAETFSHICYLLFFSSSNDNTNIPHRVTWHGNNASISQANQGKQDATVYCYGFYLLIEATLKTGVNQCSQEFAPALRHCEYFCSQNNIPQNSVYVLIVCSDLHIDTYQSIKNDHHEYKVIPIKVLELMRILETSILAFTMRHLELRDLLNQISDCIKNSLSLSGFSSDMDGLLTKWQKEILKSEENAFIGVESYKAMRKINRLAVSTSEIFRKLQRHPIVKHYFKIIGEKLGFDIIEQTLINQSLASKPIPTFAGEKIFSPVPFADFKERGLKLIKKVEEINGKYRQR